VIDVWVKTGEYSPTAALDHVLPYQDELEVSPVSTFVNSPKNNTAKCIAQI